MAFAGFVPLDDLPMEKDMTQLSDLFSRASRIGGILPQAVFSSAFQDGWFGFALRKSRATVCAQNLRSYRGN